MLQNLIDNLIDGRFNDKDDIENITDSMSTAFHFGQGYKFDADSAIHEAIKNLSSKYNSEKYIKLIVHSLRDAFNLGKEVGLPEGLCPFMTRANSHDIERGIDKLFSNK